MVPVSNVVSRYALCTLALSFFGSGCAMGQDASEILRRTADRYQSLEAYHIEGDVRVRMQMDVGEQEMDMQVLMAELRPDFLRAEVKGPTMAVVVVTNASGTYMYMPTLNQYVFSENSAPMEVGQMTEDLLGEYRRVGDEVLHAAVVGRASVEIQGRSHESVVVDVAYHAEETAAGADSTYKRLWIDAERMLVLRDSSYAYVSETPFGSPMWITELTSFTRIDVDRDPPIALFEFTPPEDAEQVTPSEMLARGAEEVKATRAAHDFSLLSLDGQDVQLSDFRGSVVLVNFWASWCGPCRVEMPALETIYQEVRERGFTVLAVNLGEAVADVRRYVDERGYTFPILLDEASYVGSLYQAYSIPMSYVIDRQGRISRVLVGAHPESTIRDALEEAGL